MLPPEYEEYLGGNGGIPARLDYIVILLTRLLARGRNLQYVASGTVTVDTAGNAKQFPSVLIPAGRCVSIEASITNTGNVYIGSSKVGAEDHTGSKVLTASEIVEYEIEDLGQLWLDANVAGDSVAWTVEQEERR